MRIGVISDTHIPDRARAIPPEILEDFKNVEMIIHTGDFVDIGVLDRLKSVCANVKAVYGNMDSYQVRNSLPEKQVIEIGKYRIGIMHGIGAPAKLIEYMEKAFLNDRVDLVVFGHSHTPVVEKRGEILFFNPGSPTDKIFSPYNSYGIIEINDKIEARIIRL
ncbi:MAG: metallophosphoesterase [Candidatus Omnitrophica bacterium]|nr:metallophosphoesterase [Candidatus Omnitrophota bacterium]